MPPVIQIENVSKLYKLGFYGADTFRDEVLNFFARLRGKPPVNSVIGATNNLADKDSDSDLVWALKDINLTVNQGDIVGIIGKNGAGKSTLLKILSKITTPTTGSVKIRGRIASLLEVGTGMHQELTGRENIFLNGAILGMTKHEIQSKLDDIIDFAGIARYIDTPIKRYSSGMRVRLGFAIAAHLEPEILIVDEVLAVGDAEFQKRAIGKMQDISKGEGRTVLFVSHNMGSIKNLCKRGVLLKNGMIDSIGDTESIVQKYLSSNLSSQNTKISERSDRKGNGKIKVIDIVIRNADNQVIQSIFVGQYLKIEFTIDVQPNIDLSKIIVGCKLTDPNNEPVILWASDEMPHSFKDIKNNKFSLIIPQLNVRPNTYNIYYQISLNTTNPDDFCDAMNNAITIQVLNDTYITKECLLKPNRGYQAIIKGYYE